jgi:hypothetical protein
VEWRCAIDGQCDLDFGARGNTQRCTAVN